MFADDNKLCRTAAKHEDQERFQKDLSKLELWSLERLLPFNVAKCGVLHLGATNPHREYVMHDQTLAQLQIERDLGVQVDSDLKFRRQAALAVSKANQVLGAIKRSFVDLDKFTLPLLYKALVRPHLEYGNAIWGPFNKADQLLVEKVQRRATRLVPQVRHLDYQERLRRLNLPSLMYRRRRGDAILMFKLMHGQLGVPREAFFQAPHVDTTRGHRFKVAKPRAVTRVRRNHFAVRTVTDWNSLPSWVVDAPSTNAFKNRIDKHWGGFFYDIPN